MTGHKPHTAKYHTQEQANGNTSLTTKALHNHYPLRMKPTLDDFSDEESSEKATQISNSGLPDISLSDLSDVESLEATARQFANPAKSGNEIKHPVPLKDLSSEISEDEDSFAAGGGLSAAREKLKSPTKSRGAFPPFNQSPSKSFPVNEDEEDSDSSAGSPLLSPTKTATVLESPLASPKRLRASPKKGVKKLDMRDPSIPVLAATGARSPVNKPCSPEQRSRRPIEASPESDNDADSDSGYGFDTQSSHSRMGKAREIRKPLFTASEISSKTEPKSFLQWPHCTVRDKASKDPLDKYPDTPFNDLSKDPLRALRLKHESSSAQHTLNEMQCEALCAAINGDSLFFTGPAGTGKSFVLRAIIDQLQTKRSGKVYVTATTGMAAIDLHGTTLHRWAGLTPQTESLEPAKIFLDHRATSRWKDASALIIDEVSMLDGGLFEKLDILGRRVRKNENAPFGGIQVILTGDFFQLPPVRTDGTAPMYAFESKSWASVVSRTVVLTEVFRQSDDQFVRILGDVRLGSRNPNVTQFLGSLCRELKYDDGIVPSHLFMYKKDAARENGVRLAELPGKEFKFMAYDYIAPPIYHHRGLSIGSVSTSAPTSIPSPPSATSKLLPPSTPSGGPSPPSSPLNSLLPPLPPSSNDISTTATTHDPYASRQFLFNQFPAPKELSLKVDAQVMLIRNSPDVDNLVNGSMGKVVTFIPTDHELMPDKKHGQHSELECETERWLLGGTSKVRDVWNRFLNQNGCEDDRCRRELEHTEEFNPYAYFQRLKVSYSIYSDLLPVVRFTNGITKVIKTETWENVDPEGNVLATRRALPLIHSWAITIHKSQGQSLDRVIVDVTGGNSINYGQLYVALSRARSHQHLQLMGFTPSKIRCSPRVLKHFGYTKGD